MTRTATREERDDLAMMRQPGRWPAWPWLPMKQRNGDQLAVLHADAEETGPVRLYFVNLFDAKGYFPNPEWLNREFANFDAILAAGWIVD